MASTLIEVIIDDHGCKRLLPCTPLCSTLVTLFAPSCFTRSDGELWQALKFSCSSGRKTSKRGDERKFVSGPQDVQTR